MKIINRSKLHIEKSYSEYIEYIALAPVDTEFEATSYDAAGRVKKIYDNDNNVLKEFNYNVVL